MSETQPSIGESRAYWTHQVQTFPSPVSVIRMAQLIDFDDRLYETARVVYRFMISWYHQDYGDALLSQRHVAKVMKQRAPGGSVVPSRNAVQRAIIALMDTGWVVRSFQGRGKGKGASRYVPVINVLELASHGNFPQPAHSTGPVQPAHANGPPVAHANGPVDPEPAHANGPKTHLPDPRQDAETGKGIQVSADAAAPGPSAAPSAAGFERIWKAYGKLGNKVAARAVFEGIANPDVDNIAARASSWAASARPGKPRMPLEKWLGEEKYDEADRKAATQTEKPAPVKLAPDKAKPVDAELYPRREVLTIKTAFVEDGTLSLALDDADGRPRYIDISVEAADKDVQEKGQAELGRLCDAAGIFPLPDDPAALLGKSFVRIMPSKFAPKYLYEPNPANDNIEHEVAS